MKFYKTLAMVGAARMAHADSSSIPVALSFRFANSTLPLPSASEFSDFSSASESYASASALADLVVAAALISGLASESALPSASDSSIFDSSVSAFPSDSSLLSSAADETITLTSTICSNSSCYLTEEAYTYTTTTATVNGILTVTSYVQSVLSNGSATAVVALAQVTAEPTSSAYNSSTPITSTAVAINTVSADEFITLTLTSCSNVDCATYVNVESKTTVTATANGILTTYVSYAPFTSYYDLPLSTATVNGLKNPTIVSSLSSASAASVASVASKASTGPDGDETVTDKHTVLKTITSCSNGICTEVPTTAIEAPAEATAETPASSSEKGYWTTVTSGTVIYTTYCPESGKETPTDTEGGQPEPTAAAESTEEWSSEAGKPATAEPATVKGTTLSTEVASTVNVITGNIVTDSSASWSTSAAYSGGSNSGVSIYEAGAAMISATGILGLLLSVFLLM